MEEPIPLALGIILAIVVPTVLALVVYSLIKSRRKANASKLHVLFLFSVMVVCIHGTLNILFGIYQELSMNHLLIIHVVPLSAMIILLVLNLKEDKMLSSKTKEG